MPSRSLGQYVIMRILADLLFDSYLRSLVAQVALLAGFEIANEPVRPIWNPGDFFGEMFGKERRGTTP